VTKLEWVALSNIVAGQSKKLVQLKKIGIEQIVDKIDKVIWNKALDQAEKLINSSAFSILTQVNEGYPKALFQLNDPPACIYVMGNLPESDAIAMVGTRSATPLGLSLARSFGYDLAKAGLVVVSGLADGIDQASQFGAMDAKGKTVSILGEGFNALNNHKKNLINQIITDGAVISEFPPDFPAANWTYPTRNRIIACLSKATLVIEAPQGSGALITSQFALELGKEVLATPGAPGVQSFVGCNKLIKDGAKLVDCVEDVLDVFGIKQENTQTEKMNDIENAIFDYCVKPQLIDSIADHLGMTVSAIMGYLTVMNLRGLISKTPGGFYVKASFTNAKTGKNRAKKLS
jgi:DNA processing protein